jgi:CubicO group peptidase (beta-lactamase class C family)
MIRLILGILLVVGGTVLLLPIGPNLLKASAEKKADSGTACATAKTAACDTKSSEAAACAPAKSGAACAPSTSCAPAKSGAACAPSSSTHKSGAACANPCGGDGTSISVDPAREASKVPAGATPRDFGWKDLSQTLEPFRARFRVPGLAAALVIDGEIAAVGVTGVRKAGAPARIGLDDRFHIGSCGKSFTATVAASLVSEGLISWDTRLVDVFPELSKEMDPVYRPVTLRQLVMHRGGLPELHRPDSPMWRRVTGMRVPVGDQRQELVRLAVHEKAVAEPGAEFFYTDLGYAVVGRMLERASGQTWEELVRTRIAEPLGLTTLGFGAPGTRGKTDQPWGHQLDGTRARSISPGPGADLAAPVIGPAGTIHLSIADWARYAKHHLALARAARDKRAGKSSVLYADPYSQGYAMGWAVTEQPWAGGRLLSHTGSCGAWAAAIWIAPEVNAAIVVASNYGGSEGFAAAEAAAMELAKQFAPPTSSSPGAQNLPLVGARP